MQAREGFRGSDAMASQIRDEILTGGLNAGTPRAARALRAALIALAATSLALGLAGCGRKGPLDLPPSADASAQTPAAAPHALPSVIGGSTSDPTRPEPVVPKRRLPIDTLLE